MSEFTLSRREPKYLNRAKATRNLEDERFELEDKKNRKLSKELESLITNVLEMSEEEVIDKTTIGSVIYANKPGDGSAREQAASCQRVLGGRANIAVEYATKRYRSNMINWEFLPFITDEKLSDILENGDYIYIENIRESIISGRVKILAKLIKKNSIKLMNLNLDISAEERKVLLDGCLINFYKNKL